MMKFDFEGIESMENKKPFLSIIMRTQGKRLEALQEALLCLYAQTDMDYEVCLMAHKVSDEDMERITETVDSMPQILRERVRIIPVTFGGRTAPLSEGFQAAKGEYTAAFDDDDLVFEHWVETFHHMAAEHGGKILHTYCVQQKWVRDKSPYGESCYTAWGKLQKEYCTDFEFVRQLCVNYCPIHSLAFPTRVYQELGVHFDETFEVTEDWDFLMRAALVCGVANQAEVTSLYRIWENYENSKTLNEMQIWEKNKKRILGKLDAQPLVLPRGSASKIAGYIEQNPMHAREAGSGQKLWMQLFFDTGKGYNEKDSVHVWASTANGIYQTKTKEVPKQVRTLRIDPGEAGMFILENVNVAIHTQDGQQITKTVQSCNGYSCKGRYLFLEDDPQLYVELSDIEEIAGLEFSAKYSYELTGELIEEVINQLAEEEYRKKKSVVYRCKQIMKTVLGR